MIRHADLKDFDRIMEMMVNFANHAPVEALNDPHYNIRRIQHLLSSILANGCIIVATDSDDVIQGMIIAMIQDDIWLPHVKTLKEVAWWVEEDYRHTSMGYKLLLEYIKFGKQLKDLGSIMNFTLTNMSISPDFDLEKRGWKNIETNYVYEGK
tara:strand:- start:339 stop:797 length:459 start_codon:yes stop_codon:yes gene_type:complete